MRVEEINPYIEGEDKGKQVEHMFDSIAHKYDLMNKAMSLGQHHRWRDKALKAAIKELKVTDNLNILDVATGTGDLTFRLYDLLPSACITAIDLSEGMLEIARNKLKSLPIKAQKDIVFGKADSLALPFHDSTFQFITVAYGVRNFSDLRKGVTEMRRVLSPQGVLCIIELSTPTNFITRGVYKLYSGKVIPWIGKKVSGDSRAYSYLPESIEACPQRDDMASLLYAAGFNRVEYKSLSFGAVTYYIAK